MKNVKSPKPFFDTMEEMPNPFKNPVLEINSITSAEPEGALSDYQHASEFIYSKFSTPLICSSNGAATVSAITDGFAPGKLAEI